MPADFVMPKVTPCVQHLEIVIEIQILIGLKIISSQISFRYIFVNTFAVLCVVRIDRSFTENLIAIIFL